MYSWLWAFIRLLGIEFLGPLLALFTLVAPLAQSLLTQPQRFIKYTVAEEGLRSHYGWLWATMWLLGFELRTFRRAVSALTCWAISPAPDIDLTLVPGIFPETCPFHPGSPVLMSIAFCRRIWWCFGFLQDLLLCLPFNFWFCKSESGGCCG